MKKHFRSLLFLLILASLTGCSSFHTKLVENPKIEIAHQQWIILPTPAEMAFNIDATQILTAQYKIKNKTSTYTAQIQVEKTPDHLILLAVSGWGGEIFSLSYDGNFIKTNSLPMPNSEMGIQHTLTDFILTYADTNLLKKTLSTTSIKLIEKPLARLFVLHNKTIIRIDYQNKNPWLGNIFLQSFDYHYTIKIITIKTHET